MAELGRTEQIIAQFLLKTLQAVLAARIPHHRTTAAHPPARPPSIGYALCYAARRNRGCLLPRPLQHWISISPPPGHVDGVPDRVPVHALGSPPHKATEVGVGRRPPDPQDGVT